MAASKVNVKFVVVLGTVLGLVFVGVALSFAYIKFKSGDRYAGLAETAAAAGDYKKADGFWARAVGKDQSRVDWLTKWRDTRRKVVPETQSAVSDDYQMYLTILRTLANAKRTDLAAHREYLNELYDRAVASRGSVPAWRMLIAESELAMRFFEPDHPASLRRFRGAATMSLSQLGTDLSDTDLNGARDDLEAAVKADPTDSVAASNLALWHALAAKKALDAEEKDKDKANAEFELAMTPLSALLAASPDNPAGLVAKISFEAARVDLLADPKLTPAQAIKARAEAYEKLRPGIKVIADKLVAADPSKLTPDTVARFASVAQTLDPKGGAADARRVVERALEGNKDSLNLISLRGQMLEGSGDIDGAMADYQRIIDMPARPVSLEAVLRFDLRRAAMFQQTNAAMARALVVSADKTATEADRKASMDRVDKYREQLARNVPEHAPELALIDGKVKFLQGDLRGAQQLLGDFVRAPGPMAGRVFEARLLLSDIATRLGQVGKAIEELDKAREARPGSPDVLLGLAQLHMQIQQNDRAVALYSQVLELDPSNEVAAKNLPIAKALLDGATVKVGDPVTQLLIEAQRIQQGTTKTLGDEQAAVDMLVKALPSNGFDPRLVMTIARMKWVRNDADGAKAVLKGGLEKHPDDATMKSFLSQLESSGTIEGVLALIDAQQAEPVEKLWSKHQAYLAFGKRPEAIAALTEMAKLAPNDARAIEAQFLIAVGDNNLVEAQRLTDLAVQTNADRADGDTYKARVLLAKGDLKEAVALMERAAQRHNSTAPQLRMLGVVQIRLGREQGLTTLKQALDLNPTDLTTIKMYLGALVQLNRRPDALALARESANVAQHDPEFLSAWLALESSAGNRSFAVERREQIYARSPDDLMNGVALADLYTDAKQWDKARALIDKLREGRSADVAIANVDARWHADKGDLEGARKVFVDLIEAVGKALPAGKEPPPDPYLVFGQFMIQRGRADWGLAAMRQAERLQDPKTMSVSIALGEVQLSLGQFPEAEKTLRKVVDAKVADPENHIHKLLIESLVQQRRFEEAEKEFVKLGPAADEDVELLAQRAFAARGMGDLRRARDILDRAVVKFPTEPLPYLRRARILMLDPRTVRDAMADLDTALKIRPAMWQARRTRGTLLLSQGEVDAGIKDLMAAVESASGIDGLRLELIDTLLRLGRETEAVDVAEAGLKPRPNDVRLIGSIGDHFAAAGRWARAVRYYKMLWQQLSDEGSAVLYADALLSSTPPALADAEAVLSTPSLNTDKSLELLMLRATLRRKQGREDDAKRDALIAFDRSTANPASLSRWTERLRRPFPEPRAALDVMRAATPPAALADWLKVRGGSVMIEDPAMRTEGISLLEGLLANSPDRDVKIEVCRVLPQAYNSDSKWQEAITVSKQGLELKPDDVMFINNMAWFLSEKMELAKDALPYAERAAQLAPEDNRILDTLALVNWRLGNREKAMQSESESLRRAQSETDKAERALTLGRWRLESKDKAAATGLVSTLREMLTDTPSLGAAYSSKVDQLEKDIQAAP